MKTILVAIEFPPAFGGVETYYAKLAEYWPDEFAVITNQSNELLSKGLPFLKWSKAVGTILKTVKNSKPDWLIAGEILPIGTAMWLVSFFTSYKYAVVLHGLDFALATRSPFKRWLSKKILTRANKIISANSKTVEELAKFLKDSSRIVVVNPGVDPEKPMVRPGLAAALRANYGLDYLNVIITIARLVPRKGIDTMLSILPQILETCPNTAYVIIGKGPDEHRLKEMMRDPALSGKVFIMTDTTDEEKWAWLEISDIFSMPTREIGTDYEGFGIVYLEANLFSKPVVATNSGGVKDAVSDHVNGLLIPSNNSDALAKALIDLLQDKNLRESLGQKGKERFVTDFAWSKQVSLFYNALKNN